MQESSVSNSLIARLFIIFIAMIVNDLFQADLRGTIQNPGAVFSQGVGPGVVLE